VGFAPLLLVREADYLHGCGETETAGRRLEEALAVATRLGARVARERAVALRESWASRQS